MHNNLNGFYLSGLNALCKADGREPLFEPTVDNTSWL